MQPGEVEAEVFRAPARRVDNEISRLSDSVQALTMHCRVLHAATSEYKSALAVGIPPLASLRRWYPYAGCLGCLSGGTMYLLSPAQHVLLCWVLLCWSSGRALEAKRGRSLRCCVYNGQHGPGGIILATAALSRCSGGQPDYL